MTFFYKGKEIGQRELAVEYIYDLPIHELHNLIYTYLDQFDEEHLKDLIWSSLDNMGWTLKDFIRDALIILENDWELAYSMDTMLKGETVSLGDVEYENWAWAE